jgi:glycosyltransferase involved in cell wall biosynthesis
MTTPAPQISVVMPVYNGEAFLGPAVESILAQTCRDFEFLIIDDGSTDGTPAILREFEARDPRVRVLCQEHGGLVAALNAGVAAARAPLIARMDADDVSTPERFALQLAYLQAHPECVVLGTAMEVVDPDGAPIYTQPSESSHETLVRNLLMLNPEAKGGMAHPTVMMRREAVLAVGGYRTDYDVEDIDLWLRLAERGRLANLPEICLQYRLHPQSYCHQRSAVLRRGYARLVRNFAPRLGFTPPPDAIFADEPLPGAADPYKHWCRMACLGGHRLTALKYAWRMLRRRRNGASLWSLSDSLLGIGPTDKLKQIYGRLFLRHERI